MSANIRKNILRSETLTKSVNLLTNHLQKLKSVK